MKSFLQSKSILIFSRSFINIFFLNRLSSPWWLSIELWRPSLPFSSTYMNPRKGLSTDCCFIVRTPNSVFRHTKYWSSCYGNHSLLFVQDCVDDRLTLTYVFPSIDCCACLFCFVQISQQTFLRNELEMDQCLTCLRFEI